MENSGLTLAIETSGRSGSVALARPGSQVIEKAFSGYMKQSAELFPSVSQLLDTVKCMPSDIRQIVITAGPGSFTGLRIAVTAAKMFHFALKTPIIGIDSLDVIAENASDYMQQSGRQIDHIAVVLDAKKDFFYAAVYDRTPSGWQKWFDTAMVTAPQLLERLQGKSSVSMLGEGLLYHKPRFEAPNVHFLPSQWWQPHARNLLRLGLLKAQNGSFVDPMALTPFYIRPPDAVIKSRE